MYVGGVDDDTLRLVRQALDAFEEMPLAGSLRRAVRIAQLRQDFNSLWWLSLEHGSREFRASIRGELAPHYSRDEFKRLHDHFTERFIRERTITNFRFPLQPTDEEMVDVSPVGVLEEKVKHLSVVEEAERLSKNADLAAWAQVSRGEFVRVLEDIRVRVHNYLSRAEAQLLAGHRPDVLLRSREYLFQAL